MYKSYLKIAWRNLRKSRVFSIINIAGLAVGIAAFLLILEYVSFERSYNQFHQKLPNLYRLLTTTKEGQSSELTAPGVGPLVKAEFGEVANYCRVASGIGQGIVTTANGAVTLRSFREEGVLLADGSFFDLFSFPVLTGQVSRLTQPNTVAMSATAARNYFDAKPAVGQVLTLNNQFGKTPYTVVAVYADMPPNSDIQTDLIFSLATLNNPANLGNADWVDLKGLNNGFLQAYLQLPDETNLSALESKLTRLIRQRSPNFAETKATINLQPVRQMHLADSLANTYPTTGKLSFVYLMGGIALLILLIAWFNYVNLSTVASLKRSKEVGVRKVAGATRWALIGQFLGESLLLNILGFGVGLLLLSLLQKPFNDLVGRQLSLSVLASGNLWVVGLAFLLIGALASGGYTAFALSGMSPIRTLKGNGSAGAAPAGAPVRYRSWGGSPGRGGALRQSLVVFQFAVSIALIVSTVILYRQLQYMQTQELGVTTAQVLVIRGPEVGKDSTYKQRSSAFRNELAGQSFVQRVSLTGSVPGQYYNFSTAGITKQRNARPDDDKTNYNMAIVDDHYLPTFGITLAAGRNITPAEAEKGWSSHRVMLNETAVKALGFASAQAAIGQQITWQDGSEVVGVVKDYHHQSLQQSIGPIVFQPAYNEYFFALKLTTGQIQANIAQLSNLYRQYFPGNPFDYYFADEQYSKQYQTEQQYGRIFTTAASLAILIACLGLFGLAAFTAEQRTKEIGVRKVLGASVASIVTLLSKDFLKLVLIAIVIASPLAWFAMNRWLQDFAYKIDIEWWVFALAGLLAVSIALLTVSFQSVKAALMNPVKSLRSE
ncbi:ABC transporter permease [Spirosoma arcticum]